MLALVLGPGHRERGIAHETVAALTAGFPARRLRLAGKGAIAVGNDADLALAALDGEHVLRPEELQYRHKHSPYVGRRVRARVMTTILRGRLVFAGGQVVGEPAGRLVTPSRQETA
jgi:allantoinase